MQPGIDVVEVAQVRQAIATFGQRYLRRLHTEAELGALQHDDPEQLALRAAERFAAKEAVFKALQLPSSVTMGWHAIELDEHLAVSLHGPARAWATEHHLTTLRVSTTRTADHAMAVAVAS